MPWFSYEHVNCPFIPCFSYQHGNCPLYMAWFSSEVQQNYLNVSLTFPPIQSATIQSPERFLHLFLTELKIGLVLIY